MLSYNDIKKEIGKNIYISPFNPDNIRGASINLTASKFAWSVKTKKSAYNPNRNKIIIKKRDTILLETEECIYVTNKIAGTYHSRVKLVSTGIGHIGTTLDPGWVGNSLISLHNNTNKRIELDIGEKVVSICFYYLKNKSQYAIDSNSAGRNDILTGYKLDKEARNWLNSKSKKDRSLLISELLHSKEYISFNKQRIVDKGWWAIVNWRNGFNLIRIAFSILILYVTFRLLEFSENDSLKDIANFIKYSLIVTTPFILRDIFQLVFKFERR